MRPNSYTKTPKKCCRNCKHAFRWAGYAYCVLNDTDVSEEVEEGETPLKVWYSEWQDLRKVDFLGYCDEFDPEEAS